MRATSCRGMGVGWLVLCLLTTAAAEEPLHVRIDRLIDAGAAVPAAARTTEAEFLRRAWLDFAGRIPSADDARAFLADTAADKREKLIDRLLAGPDYPQRMTEAFTVLLMERRGTHPDWEKFLRLSFERNKPWDQMVREILCPDPDDEATRGAAYFITQRLYKVGENPTDYPGLTRDVGRLFLGRDLQCAQCHDHLFVDDYKQAQFQGLYAFFLPTFIRTDVKFPAVGEKPVTEKLTFASVFVQQEMKTGPRLPGGMEIEIPHFEKGDEFAVPPDKKTRHPGVPKFRPLAALARQLPRADNEQFTRNAANRLWFLLMGRGLVHPLDLHHAGNPPSHPELLDLLSKEFAAHGFDIKWLLRELALTETYQRSSLLPDGTEPQSVPPQSFRVALERPLSAEQLLHSTRQATGESSHPADAKQLDALQTRFVKAFGNPPQEPEESFAPSLKAALFVLNDTTILGWLEPRDGNLIDRLAKLDTPEAIAGELYLSTLTRLPTDEERAEVAAYLDGKTGAARTKALGHLAWALLASTEFCLNH